MVVHKNVPCLFLPCDAMRCTVFVIVMGELNLQDRKMTDKSVYIAGENMEHVVLTFKNHHTKLINVPYMI